MHPHDTPPDDGGPRFEEADRRIAEAFGRLPSPDVPTALPNRVLARISRRRMRLRVAGLAAAAATLLLGWSVWRPRSQGPVVAEDPSQEALLAQWDELLDEAAALPPVVVDLSILETQRAWTSALQDVQRR